MLEAIIHSKVRGRLRELVYDGGRAQGSLHRDLHEDVITSTVFGPLQYMTTEQCWQNIRQILLNGKSEHPAEFKLDEFKPDRHELKFWPSLKVDGETRVEPDLIIEFRETTNEQLLVVLLEVKWGAELSADQLRNQKQATIDAYKKNKSTKIAQIFLAHLVNTEEARKQIEDGLCHTVTWNQIAVRIRNSMPKDNIWTEQLRKLLSQLGIVPFTGFNLAEHATGDEDRAAVLDWSISPWRFDEFGCSREIDNESLGIIQQWRITQ